MTSETLIEKIFHLASKSNIPAAIIGGLALPAYDVARTTLDIDISLYFENQKSLDDFVDLLKQENIQTLKQPKLTHDLFTVFGFNNEAEIWLKPCDAFRWDEKMVNKINHYSKNISVLSLEDFIMTKLARMDRSSTDISDIIQLLTNNYETLDWEYFRYRLKWAGLEKDFKEIIKGIELDIYPELKVIFEDILEKIGLI